MKQKRAGRPLGMRMDQMSKDQISASKKGSKHTQKSKDKTRATLLSKTPTHSQPTYLMKIGNKFMDRRGYINICVGGGRKIREHRLVIERQIKRRLRPEEVIHHLDTNKQNNDKKNLFLCSTKEHIEIHTWMRHNSIEEVKHGSVEFKRLLDEVIRPFFNK